jgi:MerR family Zn(II)-responsive transcriptional regulator of zntA
MIAELQVIQHSLQRLAETCCGDVHSSACCSILEALEKGEAPHPEICCPKD